MSTLTTSSPLSTPSPLPATLSSPHATYVALGIGIPGVLIILIGGFIAVWCHCRRPKPQERRRWLGSELREGRSRRGGEVRVWWWRQPKTQEDRAWIGSELRESRAAVKESRLAVKGSGLGAGGDGRVWWL